LDASYYWSIGFEVLTGGEDEVSKPATKMNEREASMTIDSRLIAARTLLTALVLACFTCPSQAGVAPEHGSLTNLDKRITGQPKAALAPARVAAVDKARRRIPDIQIDFDDIVGSPKWIRSQKGFLSRPLDRGG
jgi:hypothetical protein